MKDSERMRQRIRYIDFMKGAAMVLVIVSHTLPMHRVMQECIATLHNSAFFLASGILIARDRDKEFVPLVSKSAKKLLYPFAIWSMLYLLGEMLIGWGREALLAGSISDVVNKLWFLPVLFAAHIVVVTLMHSKVSNLAIGIAGTLLVIAGLFISSFIAKMLFFILLVWVGAWIDKVIDRNRLIIGSCIWALLCIARLFLEKTAFYNAFQAVQLGGSFIISFFGALAMLGLAKLAMSSVFKEAGILNAVNAVGRDSIYFYVLHFVGVYYLQRSENLTGGGISGA